MREKGRKAVFKTGLFHAKDSNTIVPLPQDPAASTRAKEVSKVINRLVHIIYCKYVRQGVCSSSKVFKNIDFRYLRFNRY